MTEFYKEKRDEGKIMVENNDIVMEHLPTQAKTEVRKYASLLD
jgi:hypothetical protein